MRLFTKQTKLSTVHTNTGVFEIQHLSRVDKNHDCFTKIQKIKIFLFLQFF